MTTWAKRTADVLEEIARERAHQRAKGWTDELEGTRAVLVLPGRSP